MSMHAARKPGLVTVALLVLGLSAGAQARNTELHLSIEDAMNSRIFKERLDPDIRFYFGNQPHAAPASRLGDVISNRKTNAVGKSDVEACEWVLLSALLGMQQRAREEGANAIVNIRSYYRKDEFSSETEFECHAGELVAAVALIGDVVVLP
jgi:uncharacterized protein YbjQ (UPF0145 family)